MKAFDERFASPFRVDWIAAVGAPAEDDYARAVAEKADVLLRSAAFLDLQRATAGADLEVRVWIEAACGSACVSVTWEPGARRHGFYLLDETLRERLGCVVFDGVPCVDAAESQAQGDRILGAALRAMREAHQAGAPAEAWKGAIEEATSSVRVPVSEGTDVDLGVDP